MPTEERWLKDLERQHQLHTNQGSNHYAFSFPEMNNLIIIGWLCLKI